MSDEPAVAEHEDLEDGAGLPPESDSSLRARMERRRRELAEQTTKKFGVPRWSELLEVELRVLGDKELETIEMRAQSGRGRPRLLYMQADQLVAATVGFYAYNDAGELEPIEGSPTWGTLARLYAGFELPERAGERAAFLALVGSANVTTMFGEWRMWLAGEGLGQVDEEVTRDFGPTA